MHNGDRNVMKVVILVVWAVMVMSGDGWWLMV